MEPGKKKQPTNSINIFDIIKTVIYETQVIIRPFGQEKIKNRKGFQEEIADLLSEGRLSAFAQDYIMFKFSQRYINRTPIYYRGEIIRRPFGMPYNPPFIIDDNDLEIAGLEVFAEILINLEAPRNYFDESVLEIFYKS